MASWRRALPLASDLASSTINEGGAAGSINGSASSRDVFALTVKPAFLKGKSIGSSEEGAGEIRRTLLVFMDKPFERRIRWSAGPRRERLGKSVPASAGIFPQKFLELSGKKGFDAIADRRQLARVENADANLVEGHERAEAHAAGQQGFDALAG